MISAKKITFDFSNTSELSSQQNHETHHCNNFTKVFWSTTRFHTTTEAMESPFLDLLRLMLFFYFAYADSIYGFSGEHNFSLLG